MSKKKILPEYRAQYLTDYFVDYAGNKRMFTLCAISIPLDADEDMMVGVVGTGADIKDCLVFDKQLKLGMAVQCPEDPADEELGKKIAYGKAVKYSDHVMAVTDAGMINTVMVDALLHQEAEFFKRNPESYIAGYKKKMFQYWKQKTIEENMPNTYSGDPALNPVKAMRWD